MLNGNTACYITCDIKCVKCIYTVQSVQFCSEDTKGKILKIF